MNSKFVYVVYSVDQCESESEELAGVFESAAEAKQRAFDLFMSLANLEDEEGEPLSVEACKQAQSYDDTKDCFADDTIFVYFKKVRFHPKK